MDLLLLYFFLDEILLFISEAVYVPGIQTGTPRFEALQ